MRVQIEETAAALEADAGALSGKVDDAERQIDNMAGALENPALAGSAYDALRERTSGLAVPAAKALYAALDAQRCACASDASAVRGLPQSSAGVCDTDELRRRIGACDAAMAACEDAIASLRASGGGGAGQQGGASYVQIQVEEAIEESQRTAMAAYQAQLELAEEYDASSAATYADAQSAASVLGAAAASVASCVAGAGWGDMSWADAASDAYGAAFGRRVREAYDAAWHDGGPDEDALAGLLSGGSLTVAQREALARVWGDHSGEGGAAEAFARAGMADGRPTGAFSQFVGCLVGNAYSDAGGARAIKDDTAALGSFLDATKRILQRLFSVRVEGKAGFDITVTLPDGTAFTWSRESSVGVGDEGELQEFLRRNEGSDGSSYQVDADLGDGWSATLKASAEGVSVTGAAGTADLAAGWSVSGSADGKWAWVTATHEDDGMPGGMKRTESTSAGSNRRTGQVAAREVYATSADADPASGETTETYQVTSGAGPSPSPGVATEGLGEAATSTSSVPEGVTSPLTLPDVGWGAVRDGATMAAPVVVLVVVGFVLGGPPGALEGAMAGSAAAVAQ